MLSLSDVREARERIADVARHTPLEYSPGFSERTGAEIYLKLENFQRTGAFKIRGAMNRIVTLSDEEQAAGVVTASAGNHAQGVALAAQRTGVDATIVMPEHAPISKIRATENYGARVVLHIAPPRRSVPILPVRPFPSALPEVPPCRPHSPSTNPSSMNSWVAPSPTWAAGSPRSTSTA